MFVCEASYSSIADVQSEWANSMCRQITVPEYMYKKMTFNGGLTVFECTPKAIFQCYVSCSLPGNKQTLSNLSITHERIYFTHKSLVLGSLYSHWGGYLWLQSCECSCEQRAHDSKKPCDSFCSKITFCTNSHIMSMKQKKWKTWERWRNLKYQLAAL